MAAAHKKYVRLSDAQWREIYARYTAGIGAAWLIREFGVSKTTFYERMKALREADQESPRQPALEIPAPNVSVPAFIADAEASSAPRPGFFKRLKPYGLVLRMVARFMEGFR